MSLVFSIDPGTTMIGFALSEIDTGNRFTPVDARSVDLEAMAKAKYGFSLQETHGVFYSRIRCVYDAVTSILNNYNPDYLVIESSFMGKFAAAFDALVQCISAIKQAYYDYCPTRAVNMITPSEIKTYVGVSGRSGDKDLMYHGVKPLLVNTGINIDQLDQHAIDAVAGGYAFYSRLILNDQP